MQVNYSNLTAEDGFRRLAFGSVADAMRLLSGEEFTPRKLKNLDLMNVESIKRSDKGSVEIKFFDRNKALQMLMAFGTDEERERIERLYRAIEGGA